MADPPIEAVGKKSGEATKRAQERLLELGFWLREANGKYDETTAQAVMAFQKYFGLETDSQLGDLTAEALTFVTVKPHGRADAGTMVEIDKGKQLLFIVHDGKPMWTLNTSTGSEVPYVERDKNTPGKTQSGDAVTRNGLHEVYRERADGWWKGDLGEIYRPKYFSGGEAVHGSNHIPDYPASHGCVRVTTAAMDWIWENELMPMGLPVWVHEGSDSPYDVETELQNTLDRVHNGLPPVDVPGAPPVATVPTIPADTTVPPADSVPDDAAVSTVPGTTEPEPEPEPAPTSVAPAATTLPLA